MVEPSLKVTVTVDEKSVPLIVKLVENPLKILPLMEKETGYYIPDGKYWKTIGNTKKNIGKTKQQLRQT